MGNFIKVPNMVLSNTAPALPALNDYKNAALTIANLRGLWMMDEASGPVLDYSGQGKDASQTGSAYLTRRQGTVLPGIDLGVAFNGGGSQNNGYTTSTPLNNLGASAKTNGISVAFIFQGTATGRSGVLGVTDAAGNFLRVHINNTYTGPTDTTNVVQAGYTTFSYKNGAITRSITSRNVNIYDGNPHLVIFCMVTAGSGSAVYIDGVADNQLAYSYNSTLTDTSTPAEFTSGISLGNINVNGTLSVGLQGNLRGVGIWSNIVTATQAAMLNNALRGTS